MFFVFLILLFRFGPFGDRGLPMAGLSRQVSFYEVRVVSFDPQPPNRGARVLPFVRHRVPNLSGLDVPKSS